MTIDELKSLLSRFNIRPSKKLGQNFLLSDEVLDKIVEAAELTRDDTVLEIGPGLGTLTKRLGEKAGLVLAIEKDRKMVVALRKLFKSKENIKVIHGDALFFDPTSYNLQANSYKVVANIPYYITGKLLQNFLALKNFPPHEGEQKGVIEDTATMTSPSPSSRGGGYFRPSLMVLLLQKEVAERIVAGPGEMSILSVSVQFYSDPEIVDYVSKENFYPVPEVDSAIVRLVPPHPPPPPMLRRTGSPLLLGRRGRKGEEGFGPRFDVDEKKFMQLVKIGFSNKRKQLQNNLTALPVISPPHEGEKEGVVVDLSGARTTMTSPRPSSRGGGYFKKVLSSLGLNPLARAQDLSLPAWERLYNYLTEVNIL